jgi:hypothetical protein
LTPQATPEEEPQMICTLTARRLKPGAFDAFREAFEKAGVESVPQEIVKRWSRVYVCRDVTDENVALTFGFFEGTLEELREIQRQGEGGPRSDAGPMAPHIEEVLLDGSYAVLEEITP